MKRETKKLNYSISCIGCSKYCISLSNGHHLCNHWGPISKAQRCDYYITPSKTKKSFFTKSNVKYCQDCVYFCKQATSQSPFKSEQDAQNRTCIKYRVRSFNIISQISCSDFCQKVL